MGYVERYMPTRLLRLQGREDITIQSRAPSLKVAAAWPFKLHRALSGRFGREPGLGGGGWLLGSG